MQSEDDSLTTLSKWPFILGDVLLVATALAIAILGDWQLTNWQVASCVISVALGAALFILPYIVEYQVRVREEREDRGAELRILHKHVVSGREELEEAAERIEAIELALSNLGQAKQPDISAPLKALEQKIDPIATQQSDLTEKLAGLGQRIEELSTQLEGKLDADALKSLEGELSELKKEVAEIPAKAPLAKTPEVEPAEEKAKTPKIEPRGSSKKPIERPSRSPRERRSPEPRLIKRAIDQKQDKSSAAVSRIIESTQKADAPEEEKAKPAEEVKKPKPVKKAPKPKAVKKSEPKKEAREAPVVVEEAPKAEAEPTEKTEAVDKKEAPEPQRAEQVAEVDAQEDMFGESVPAQVKKRVRTKKSDTAVIASVFIGIGNKPYVRGSGAGLNWESGVEMEFEEIGKWRWIAPAEFEGPIEVQLYRNDEDADSTGKYSLEAGQQLDLSPVF